MAETYVEVVTVEDVQSHPNADRLEVATVAGYPVVVGKGTFAAGAQAAYFPPNILIPADLAAKLGVAKYLKHAAWTAIVWLLVLHRQSWTGEGVAGSRTERQ
jgi:hypothetical protein